MPYTVVAFRLSEQRRLFTFLDKLGCKASPACVNKRAYREVVCYVYDNFLEAIDHEDDAVWCDDDGYVVAMLVFLFFIYLFISFNENHKMCDSYLKLTGLSGVIDPILETFPRLKLLRLGRNHLRSTIPPLPLSLRTLAVPNNALNGTIPPLNNNFTVL